MAKKPLLNTKTKQALGSIAKGVGLGILDSIPVVGTTLKANVQDELGGQGKVNWLRLITSAAAVAGIVGALWLYASGKLTFDQLTELLNLFQ